LPTEYPNTRLGIFGELSAVGPDDRQIFPNWYNMTTLWGVCRT